PKQREERPAWGGRNLSAGPCPGARCFGSQFATWKLHSAVRGAAGRATQRGNRGDACSGDAALAGGGTLDAAGFVAVRDPRSATPCIRRRGPAPDARARARPQLYLLQQAG